MTKFKIDVVSDSVCPWCFVGYKRLNKAVLAYKSSHPDADFEVTWHPFYLNPDSPKVGVDKQAYYKSKFGEERTKGIFQTLSTVGAQEGINFRFGGKTGNTRDSHRLIQLGKNKGHETETRVMEELFKAYFENEKDITSHDDLSEAAMKAGLDEKEVEDWLASDKGGNEVDAEVQRAYAEEIHGVPNFTINNRFRIEGAQEPATLVKVFDRIKEIESEHEGKVASG